MNRINITIASLAILSVIASSCKGGKEKEQEETPMEQEQPIVEVDTMVLKRQTFQKQLLCNGNLAAIRKADLQCSKQGEVLQKVLVVNGQHVAKGALLCVSDTRDKQADLEKANHDLEKAKVELQDKLIGLGYSGDLTKVPADVRHRAEILSGYYTAKYQLQTARKALAECELHAPFAGKIANLEARAYQPGTKFGTLIDDSYFDVDFKILEAELAFVKKGLTVKITPYATLNTSYSTPTTPHSSLQAPRSFTGTVTKINPTVDEKGMIKVTARMKNNSPKLIDGMNVKVIVENAVPQMFVVPKEAVVERDGYHVVFIYNKETKRAVWTYVDIAYSNLNSYAITGCAKKETEIKTGDIVITSGNLNLADDTEVRINKDK